jgi:probable RNA-binding protein EIF1AD
MKHLKREDNSDNFDLPTEQQKIVKIVKSNGNNLHLVEGKYATPCSSLNHFSHCLSHFLDSESSENYLVSMPTKFRKSFWIKRGDFVLVESIAEGEKVKGEIVRVLTQEHIKEFTNAGIWPKIFSKKRELEDDFNENPNRAMTNHKITALSSDSDSSDSETNDSKTK